MKVIIRETKESAELTCLDYDGTTCRANDIVCGSDATLDGTFLFDWGKGCYTISKKDFAWWKDFLEKQEENNGIVGELFEKYGYIIYRMIYEKFLGITDLNSYDAIYKYTFREIEKKFENSCE